MTTEELMKKCKEDDNVVYENEFQLKIGDKIYNINAFGTKMSNKCIRDYINKIESLNL